MTKPTKHNEIMETLELLARGIAETQTMLRNIETEVGMLHGRVHSIVDARFFRHYETPPQATTDLIAAEIPFEEVTPVAWQRTFGLLARKGETNVQKKNRHKAQAQQLYPAMKVTHATADALLIATYGYRRRMAETGQAVREA